VLANARSLFEIFVWVNSFKFGKYASQYLGASCYRFSRSFDLRRLIGDLILHGATAQPFRERMIRAEAEVHD
jgi:hypothetical protein